MMDEVKIIDSSQTASQLSLPKQQVCARHCPALLVSASIHHRDLLADIVQSCRILYGSPGHCPVFEIQPIN
jgi:hypothetical protein